MSRTLRSRVYGMFRHCKGWRNAAKNRARNIPPDTYQDVHISNETWKCNKYKEIK